jgi:hypothetical protein
MYEAIKELPKDIQADVYDAIFSYSLDFEKKELTGIARTIWLLIEPVLTKGNTNFVNGKQPKQKQTISETEANQKRLVSESEAYKDKDKDEYKEKDKDEEKDVDIKKSDSIESIPTFNFDRLEMNYLFKKPNEVDQLSIFKDPEVNKAFNDYLKHRITIKKPATKNAIILLSSKIRKECGTDKGKAIELLQEPVMNNWIGIVWDRKSQSANSKPQQIQFNRSSTEHYK